MKSLFGPEGDQVLQALLRQRPLLAFDFDGVLAPTAGHPAHARVAPELLPRLRALNLQLPLAVVSGRRVADLRPRLGFRPRFVLGHHGTEDEGEAHAQASDQRPGRVFGGQKVANVSAEGAPDKAAALRTLVARCGAGAALFVGADLDDEPVFAAAPAHWLTVRMGRDDSGTRARFRLADSRQLGQMLDRLLALC